MRKLMGIAVIPLIPLLYFALGVVGPSKTLAEICRIWRFTFWQNA